MSRRQAPLPPSAVTSPSAQQCTTFGTALAQPASMVDATMMEEQMLKAEQEIQELRRQVEGIQGERDVLQREQSLREVPPHRPF